jgi:hypothetical protein
MKGTISSDSFGVMIAMARSRRNQVGPLRKWWNSQSENHFQIIGIISLLSIATFLWTMAFLFILGGTTDPERDHLVPHHWLGLIISITISFFVLPEFLYFLNQRQTLQDILNLDSRSEVLKRRKEAENAADLLGHKYRARLKGLYEELGIKVKGKKFAIKSLPPRRNKSTDSGVSEEEE